MENVSLQADGKFLSKPIFYIPRIVVFINSAFLFLYAISLFAEIICQVQYSSSSQLGSSIRTQCLFTPLNTIVDFVSDVNMFLAWGGAILWLIFYGLSLLLFVIGFLKYKKSIVGAYDRKKIKYFVLTLLLPFYFWVLVYPLTKNINNEMAKFYKERERQDAISILEHCTLSKREIWTGKVESYRDYRYFYVCENRNIASSEGPIELTVPEKRDRFLDDFPLEKKIEWDKENCFQDVNAEIGTLKCSDGTTLRVHHQLIPKTSKEITIPRQ